MNEKIIYNYEKDIYYLKETIFINIKLFNYKEIIKYENVYKDLLNILIKYSNKYNYKIENEIKKENVLKEIKKLIKFIENENK